MQKIMFRRGALPCLMAASLFGLTNLSFGQSISTLMYFDGSTPQGGIVLGSDGALYGTGSESSYSAGSSGLYYRLAADGSAVTTIYEYGRLGQYTGAGPRAALLPASDGNFYGTTSYNSVDILRRTQSGTGTVFLMSRDGQSYTRLYEFDPIAVDYSRNSIGYAVNSSGADPQAALIEGTESGVPYLYGSTLRGGINGTGVIFKIRADGTGFQALHQFGEAYTVPVLDANNNPTFDLNGNPIRSFDNNADDRLRNADGVNPNQALTLIGDRLFGATTSGGPNGTGVVFSLRTDGTDFRVTPFDVSPATITDSTDANFGLRKTNTTGAYPSSNLLLVNGLLYGTATSHGGFAGPAGQGGYGGGTGFGSMYRIDPAADPMIIESVLAFTGGDNPASGSNPSGNLIIGSDGQIVGTVAGGGIRDATTTPVTVGAGAIFKFDTATRAYSTPFVFGADNQSAFDYGATPATGVVEVAESSGVAYFGIASQGGPYGIGSVFKFGAPINRDEPLGTPQRNDGGGSLTLWLLAALALFGVALNSRHYRRRANRFD